MCKYIYIYHRQSCLSQIAVSIGKVEPGLSCTFSSLLHLHAENFLNYINNKHPNIKFTMETERDGQLAFLDVNVRKSLGKFETSVYRKPTFTGLGLSFFSFSSFKFKKSAIITLLYRAYRICSNFNTLHNEFNFIKHFFKINGFP